MEAAPKSEEKAASNAFEPEDDEKAFCLFYRAQEQKIIVYPGTPQNDILSTIRVVLKIPMEKEFEVLNKDGIPVVVSSHLPNNVKLFIQIPKDYAAEAVAK